jgi:hypothetical protein
MLHGVYSAFLPESRGNEYEGQIRVRRAGDIERDNPSNDGSV